jgi:hypothetical protein
MQQIADWLEKLGMSDTRSRPRHGHLQAGRSARCGTLPWRRPIDHPTASAVCRELTVLQHVSHFTAR